MPNTTPTPRRFMEIWVANLPAGVIVGLAILGRAAVAQVGFQPAVAFQAALSPRAVACADFDLDGDQDVAVADEVGMAVVVLTNDGSGSLSVTATIGVSAVPTDIDTGDFDGDGRDDIVVARGYYLPCLVIPATSNGFSAALAVAEPALRVRAVRLNADTRSDIAGYVHFIGLGVWTWNALAQPFQFALAGSVSIPGSIHWPTFGAEHFAVGDADNDGDADVAIGVASSETGYVYGVRLYRNDGTGALGSESAPVTTGALDPLLFADFDGDGVEECLGLNSSARTLIRLEAPPSPTSSFILPTTGAYSHPFPLLDVIAGDFNADQLPDAAMVVRRSTGDLPLNIVQIGLNDGTGAFGDPIDFHFPAAVGDLATADLNADGKLDLVAVLPTTGEVVVRLNAGAPTGPTAPWVSILSGAQQSSNPGQPTPLPLVVEVTAPNGAVLNGAAVRFGGESPSGSSPTTTASPNIVATDVFGRASTLFTAPGTPTVSGSYRVYAGVDGGHAAVSTFSTPAASSGVAALTLLAGAGQSGEASTVFAQPIVVQAIDVFGAPASNRPIYFTSSAPGTASIQPANATTNAGGLAFAFVTGVGAGTATITASTTGFNGAVLFQSTSATVTVTRSVTVLSGAGQSGFINEPYLAPLVVRVLDGAGSPEAGAPVILETASGGLVTGGTTDGFGEARIFWNAGPAQGARLWRVSSPGATETTITTFNRAFAVDPTVTILEVNYFGNVVGTRLLVMAEAPVPPPASTPFGELAVSLSTAAPGFIYRDGIGIFGPTVNLVANPTGNFVGLLPGTPPPGTEIVVQALAYMPSLPFPDCWALSNAVRLGY